MKRELGLRFPANNPVCALRWPGTALPRGRMRKGGDGVLSEADAAQPERAVPLFVLSFRQRDELAASASGAGRSEEHTSELQSLMRISYAVFCLKKKNIH